MVAGSTINTPDVSPLSTFYYDYYTVSPGKLSLIAGNISKSYSFES